MTHICISKLTIIGSDNGLSPSQCQAMLWTSAGILLTQPLGTFFSEILIETHIKNAFKNVMCEMSAILPPIQCVKGGAMWAGLLAAVS